MQFIEELVVDHVLPTVRSMLARSLHEAGLTQHEIADAIGVSQSAVSKYVHGEVTTHPDVAGHDRVAERVDELAAGLARGNIDRVGALIELEVLIRELEAPGELLARMHEDAVPELTQYEDPFRVHDADSVVRRRERVRASVRRAVSLIKSEPTFVELLPQVGTNVVEVMPGGTTVDDVAGIPGRIIDVEGHVELPGDPEFGVSGHLAGVLLAAREGGSDALGAINIKYSESIVDRLASAGLEIETIPGDESVRERVRERIESNPDLEVIAQTGGFGIEPVIYVFAPDAPTAVEQVIEVAHA